MPDPKERPLKKSLFMGSYKQVAPDPGWLSRGGLPASYDWWDHRTFPSAISAAVLRGAAVQDFVTLNLPERFIFAFLQPPP